MSPSLEAGLVALLGISGFEAGRRISRLRAPFWMLGYFIPLTLVTLLALGRLHGLELEPPMCWLLAGRTEFALAAPIITLILTTPLSRLPQAQTRRWVILFMVFLAGYSSVWPFLAPAWDRPRLRMLQTRVDANGVCLQTTDYTCGPAAAVTLLRRLGLPAEEGELGVLARTGSVWGTPPDLLQAALQRRYGPSGLACRYQHFDSVQDLKSAGPTLAVIKFGFLVDHYVAVLEATDTEVVLGDPLVGLRRLRHLQFERLWRRSGITLRAVRS